MGGAIWAIAEIPADGADPPRVNGEIGTLVRRLGEAAGRESVGLVAAPSDRAIRDLQAYVPSTIVVGGALDPGVVSRAPQLAGRVATLAGEEGPSFLVLPATADGRDMAGMLAAILGWGILVNASQVQWEDGRPVVESRVFGGSYLVRSCFEADQGIITVRPSEVAAQCAPARGLARTVPTPQGHRPGGRADRSRPHDGEISCLLGGGPDRRGRREGRGRARRIRAPRGTRQRSGAAVGVTRPPVDEGWAPFEAQIGQTGKIIRPHLYVGAGISGGIQHRVGMQSAATIVAINEDPEAPIAAFSDLLVVGDLFQVIPEVIGQLKARRR